MNTTITPKGMRAGIERFVYAIIGLFGFLLSILIVFSSFVNIIKPFSQYILFAKQGLHEESGGAFAGVLGFVLLILLGGWVGKRSARLMSGWTWSIEVNGKKSYFFPIKIPLITLAILMLVSFIANYFLAGA